MLTLPCVSHSAGVVYSAAARCPRQDGGRDHITAEQWTLAMQTNRGVPAALAWIMSQSFADTMIAGTASATPQETQRKQTNGQRTTTRPHRRRQTKVTFKSTDQTTPRRRRDETKRTSRRRRRTQPQRRLDKTRSPTRHRLWPGSCDAPARGEAGTRARVGT